MSSAAAGLKPAAPFLKAPDGEEPFLEGWRCAACSEVFLADRRACPKCAAVGALKPERLANTGRLYNYTIVHRSFPGVETPFISAIVDLERA